MDEKTGVPIENEMKGLLSAMTDQVMEKLSDKFDKKALKKWRAFASKLSKTKKLADKGDPKAKRVMTVLNESGIFAGVQSMSV